MLTSNTSYINKVHGAFSRNTQKQSDISDKAFSRNGKKLHLLDF